MKVIHLSDIHLTKNRNEKMFDVNPYKNFDFVCQEICRIKNLTQIELIVVSGDISDNGDIESYRYFLTKMDSLKTPYIAILGNHDLKDNFDIAFNEKKSGYIITSGDYQNENWHIISVDTVVEKEDYGFITENNLIELERKIINNNGINTAVFMHHHAIPVNTPIVDSCMLNNANSLLTICEKYKVKFIGSGHAHTSRIWHNNNMTISVAPAVVFQWILGTEIVKISKGFGFNIIDFSKNLSLTSCLY
ncbi:metallophosphoesterase family protein [Xenorhabdus sp. Sc-CR9]|uniref:metallophosphoesterase family protein n=1 Tax=Xenorhabdus sp. Sc-CR9 TaxID=2584468 RepID=UPI001F444F4B|nr:metallophosphoesterase [Xenorhabdus sp. Sc-CR9]